MLYCMSALVCRHCRSCDISLFEDSVGKVDGFVGRIVVVSKLSLHRDHLNIKYSVVTEHFLCDLSARERQGLLAELFKLLFKRLLHEPTDKCEESKESVDDILIFKSRVHKEC